MLTLDDIFVSTRPEQIATGFEFAEGPVWHATGHVSFVDLRRSQRLRLAVDTGRLEIMAENTHRTNGQALDANGRLVVCQSGLRRILVIEDDGSEMVLADRYRGKRLNAVNDIVLRSDGSLYFTNPQGQLSGADAEIGYSGVYRFDYGGELTEVCAGMNLPNGLAFSPDESHLYVSNTRPDPKLYRFDMRPDGTAGDMTVFAVMPLVGGAESNGVPDGMKVDSAGRIYCTGPGGIWAWEPDGRQLGTIVFPEVTTNIAFGGRDGRSMFVTTHHSIFRLAGRNRW
jgi:gluconolactonase